ncbi:MAG: hypothetical protein J3K34DRAFT_496264 [Monoraphidium minutum]|nr:MAG: hypothetical protein J3K34DRAFT_496264 [Monoraphidium minutum]
MLPGLLTATTALSNALWRRASRQTFAQEVCRKFNVGSPEELQDLLAALVLCECVYKKIDMDEAALAATISEFLADFPPGLVHIDTVQLSHNGVPQSYLLATGGRTIYAAFMGTKQARDMVADVNAFHEAVWTEALQVAERSAVPTAHRGFLARSKAIDVSGLYQLAQDSGRSLVLCGHSLGGAVAKLCALRLLREQPEWPPPRMRCITFATPAVGNSALAELVEAAGWAQYFQTYILPEDQLMKALSFTTAKRQQQAAAAAAVAEQAAASGGPPPAADGEPPAAGDADGAREALTAVAGLIALPWTRERAKRKLRRELRAEEVSATPLDAAATDAAEVRATGGAAPAPRAAPAAAAGGAAALAATGLDEGGAAAGAAGAEAPPPDPPQPPLLDPKSLGLLVRLQHKWAGHQLRHTVASAAQGLGSSLSNARSLVSPFHPFGEQWYISEAGVAAPAALPPGAPLSDASLAFAAANPGIINFHRMMAYRARVLRVIYTTSNALRTGGLRLPPPGPPARPVRLGAILPPLLVDDAAARPPPPAAPGRASAPAGPARGTPAAAASWDATDGGGDSGGASPAGSPPGTAAVAAAVAASGGRAPRKGPLAFLPGGRLKEELVPLAVRVRGRGLQACRHVGVLAFGEAFVPVELAHAEAAPAAPGAGGGGGAPGPWAQLSALPHALRLRARRAAAVVSQAARGAPPPWRPPRGAPGELSLRVLLPRSLVARLAAAAAGGASPRGGGGGGGAAAPAPPLVLQLRSDCQVVSVPVRFEPLVVGVVGTTPAAAALAAALLSGEAGLEEPAPEAGAAAAAAAAPAPAGRWPQWAVPRAPAWLARARPAAAPAAGPSPAAAAAPALASAAAPQLQQARLAPAAPVEQLGSPAAEPQVLLPQPQSLEADMRRMQQLQERRERRRALAQAGGGAAWVEPWVAAGPAPTAPRQQQQHGAQLPSNGAARPPVVSASHVALPAPLTKATRAAQPVATPAKSAAKTGAGARGGAGAAATRRPGSPPRPAALSLRATRPLAAPLLAAGSKAASAAPVAASTGARAPRRGAADSPGSSRLPAVPAAALDGAQPASERAAAAPLARRSWPGAAAGILGRAQGLIRPPRPAAPLAAPLPADPLAQQQPALPGSVPASAPAAGPTAVAADSRHALRYVLLPSPPPPPPPAEPARAAAALRGLAPPPPRGVAQRAALRGVDALVFVADADSLLLGTHPAAAAAAAAAAAGVPALGLLLPPPRGAARQVGNEAAALLRELLGAGGAVAALDVADVAAAAPQQQHPHQEPHPHGQQHRRGAAGAAPADGAAQWAPPLAALPAERRAALREQVAAARAALFAALVRRADAAPPGQRSKL